ncbi:MAG: type II secretion system F family protein [Candidatus Omnitrophota bacterium]
MPHFEYVVKDEQGNDVSGVHEAATVQELIGALRQKNYTVVRVKETKKGSMSLRLGVRQTKRRIRLDDLVVFTRQLATMIEAGVPVVQSLDILTEQMDNYTFQKAIKDIYSNVEGGRSFSDSLEQHKKIFSNLYVSMVRAGEISGQLNEILDRLAAYLEKSASLQKKIKSALVYPLVVTIIAFGITLFMMTFVIPKFAEIFTSLNATLPTPTAILIAVSDAIKNNIVLFFIGVTLIGFLLSRYIKTKSGRLWFDKNLLRLPLFGPLFMKAAMSRFTRTLSTLLKSGVPILAAFDIVSKTVGNRLMELVLGEVKENIEQGGSIAPILAKKRVFPPMVVRMIGIGEETGEIEKMLSKIADFYDEQVDVAISGLTSMIEPLIIVFLGVIIGTIVVCMFLPIFTMTQTLL